MVWKMLVEEFKDGCLVLGFEGYLPVFMMQATLPLKHYTAHLSLTK